MPATSAEVEVEVAKQFMQEVAALSMLEAAIQYFQHACEVPSLLVVL